MTDQQVLDYIRQGFSEGKQNSEIVSELTLKGIKQDQIRRVRRLYEESEREDAAAAANGYPETESDDRSHTAMESENMEAFTDRDMVTGGVEDRTNQVYGRDIFRKRSLNFAPSENLATPRNYRLGPGDEVIIDIFGANQSTLRSFISPEGSIKVDVLGPIYLSGMTVEEANAYLKKRLSSIYAGLNRSGARTDIRLSLGQIRTIQVNILENVENPGTYRLSAFSSVFHALYMAGGPVDPGTVRDIQVIRDGKPVSHLDVYQFMATGDGSQGGRLEDGDLLLLKPYQVIVRASGEVKRPMLYEMKQGETVEDLLRFAGGFSTGAYTESVTLTRQSGTSYEVRTIPESNFSSFVLKDGDEIEVNKLTSRFSNKLSVFGSVYYPGKYELSEDIHTVKGLVTAAGGVLPDAFLGRAVIHREYEDRSMEVLSVNLEEILAGTRKDVELRNNDELYVASKFDLEEQGTMSISGMVMNPGEFPFAKNTTVEDLIILAGGLRDGAALSRVDVSRRVKDENATTAEKSLARIFTFPIKNGLVDDGVKSFVLEPYDEVTVFRSPSYNIQTHATVEGQVNFPGTFALSDREERLSDIIAKAGGVTQFAYLDGAILYRRRNDTEMGMVENERDRLEARQDTLSLRLLDIRRVYSVAVNLKQAIDNPGGSDDIVLRNGDRLEIPVFNNTVRVNGAVMIPNAIAYNPTYTARKYVHLSGGFSQQASRKHAYVVNMNGAAEPYRAGKILQPGSEIVVPMKEDRSDKNWNRITSSVSIFSSVASMATAFALMIRYLK
ncbi:MAG: SLBB domain-containing protein [Bacteroidales bacterium]|nr:SLBB domain-containing protein [Bacteroidales bacterium]